MLLLLVAGVLVAGAIRFGLAFLLPLLGFDRFAERSGIGTVPAGAASPPPLPHHRPHGGVDRAGVLRPPGGGRARPPGGGRARDAGVRLAPPPPGGDRAPPRRGAGGRIRPPQRPDRGGERGAALGAAPLLRGAGRPPRALRGDGSRARGARPEGRPDLLRDPVRRRGARPRSRLRPGRQGRRPRVPRDGSCAGGDRRTRTASDTCSARAASGSGERAPGPVLESAPTR